MQLHIPPLELLEGVINAGTPGRPMLSFGPRLDRPGAVPQGEAVTFISSSIARLEMVLIGYKDDLQTQLFLYINHHLTVDRDLSR
jgi:hypothetical protein